MRYFISFIACLCLGFNALIAQAAAKDKYVAYPFLNKQTNSIQYKDTKVIQALQNAWQGSAKHFVVAHFGDSHVQPDYLSGEVRKELQALKGSAGRGMVFPYNVAKIYSAKDYTAIATGVWDYDKNSRKAPRLTLGVSGYNCRTVDKTASLTFTFTEPLVATNKVIKIFCKRDVHTFDCILKTNGKEVILKSNNADTFYLPYLEVELPSIGNTITLQVLQQDALQLEFEFYGMSIEAKPEQAGVIYHGLGVDGANYSTILRQQLFTAQMPVLNPNLVIIDFGTNDYVFNDTQADLIPADMADIIKRTIDKVRQAVPQASILLTSTQDMSKKGVHMNSGEAFSALVKQVAFEQDCLFYDWYAVSGGTGAMKTWVSEQLAKNDHIHLSPKGSTLKGQLLAEALIKAMQEKD